MIITIRKENTADFNKITEVIKSAFYRDDKDSGFNEWNLVERIRETPYYINDLSLAAEVKDNIVGHIMLTPMYIRNGEMSYKSLALAPVLVHKKYQNLGIGTKLVYEAIKRAKELGYKSIIVMGHPKYYKRFGFKPASGYRIGTSKEYNDNCLFALELQQGSLDEVEGIIEYCKPFYNENGELI